MVRWLGFRLGLQQDILIGSRCQTPFESLNPMSIILNTLHRNHQQPCFSRGFLHIFGTIQRIFFSLGGWELIHCFAEQIVGRSHCPRHTSNLIMTKWKPTSRFAAPSLRTWLDQQFGEGTAEVAVRGWRCRHAKSVNWWSSNCFNCLRFSSSKDPELVVALWNLSGWLMNSSAFLNAPACQIPRR